MYYESFLWVSEQKSLLTLFVYTAYYVIKLSTVTCHTHIERPIDGTDTCVLTNSPRYQLQQQHHHFLFCSLLINNKHYMITFLLLLGGCGDEVFDEWRWEMLPWSTVHLFTCIIRNLINSLFSPLDKSLRHLWVLLRMHVFENRSNNSKHYLSLIERVVENPYHFRIQSKLQIGEWNN